MAERSKTLEAVLAAASIIESSPRMEARTKVAMRPIVKVPRELA